MAHFTDLNGTLDKRKNFHPCPVKKGKSENLNRNMGLSSEALFSMPVLPPDMFCHAAAV